MTDLYPPHNHGHSTSPNISLSAHNASHNPHHHYPGHPIYPSNNMSTLMPITQSMTVNNVQVSTSSPINSLPVSGIQNLSQNTYKDNNDNVTAPTSPGLHNTNLYNPNLPPTPNSMVTILGPNSGKFTLASGKRLQNDLCLFYTQRIATVTTVPLHAQLKPTTHNSNSNNIRTTRNGASLRHISVEIRARANLKPSQETSHSSDNL